MAFIASAGIVGRVQLVFVGWCDVFFFLNDTAPTDIYTVRNTLSLHDALPISRSSVASHRRRVPTAASSRSRRRRWRSEEHTSELQSLPTISYAVFCLKKK